VELTARRVTVEGEHMQLSFPQKEHLCVYWWN